jgi:hypothetical protein
LHPGGRQGRHVVAREIARLQFPDPVPARYRQHWVAGKMVLHPKFINISIIEAAEFRV